MAFFNAGGFSRHWKGREDPLSMCRVFEIGVAAEQLEVADHTFRCVPCEMSFTEARALYKHHLRSCPTSANLFAH